MHHRIHFLAQPAGMCCMDRQISGQMGFCTSARIPVGFFPCLHLDHLLADLGIPKLFTKFNTSVEAVKVGGVSVSFVLFITHNC